MMRSTTRVSTLLAVAVLALAGCTGGDEEEPTSAPSQEAPAVSDGGAAGAAPTASETEEASECAAEDADQEIPAEAPQADAWPNVNGVGVPVSDTYGPTNRDGEVWTCFSHSPTGALFAAAYLQAGITSASVREEYITDDPAVEDGDGESSEGTIMRGYRITSYDESEVTVELVYETPSAGESGLVAMPVTLHWAEGTWTSTQADFAAATPRSITGLSGYTQWSVGS